MPNEFSDILGRWVRPTLRFGPSARAVQDANVMGQETLQPPPIASGAYTIHVLTRDAVARNVTTTVVQPKILVRRPLTREPRTFLSLVISIIMRSKGGTEKPWTM